MRDHFGFVLSDFRQVRKTLDGLVVDDEVADRRQPVRNRDRDRPIGGIGYGCKLFWSTHLESEDQGVKWTMPWVGCPFPIFTVFRGPTGKSNLSAYTERSITRSQGGLSKLQMPIR